MASTTLSSLMIPTSAPSVSQKSLFKFQKEKMYTHALQRKQHSGGLNHMRVVSMAVGADKVNGSARIVNKISGKKNLSSKEDYPDVDDEEFGERFKLPHVTDVLDVPPRPSTFCINSRCSLDFLVLSLYFVIVLFHLTILRFLRFLLNPKSFRGSITFPILSLLLSLSLSLSVSHLYHLLPYNKILS